jgi:putative FmdB family regulatory protein
MPTYEYACSSCGNQWEEVQKISEPALEVCPKCQQTTARRQISGGRFILKGGGWYADLYSSVKPGKKDDSKGSGTSTDAKPASGGASGGSSGSSGGSGSGDSGGSSGSKDTGGTSAPAAAPASAPSTPR